MCVCISFHLQEEDEQQRFHKKKEHNRTDVEEEAKASAACALTHEEACAQLSNEEVGRICHSSPCVHDVFICSLSFVPRGSRRTCGAADTVMVCVSPIFMISRTCVGLSLPLKCFPRASDIKAVEENLNLFWNE